MSSEKQINVLLKLKRQREDQALAAFALAKGRVETLRAAVERLESALADEDRRIRQELTAGGPGRIGAAMDRYKHETVRIRGAIADHQSSMADARGQMGEARQELLEAMAQRRGLEQLADKTQSRQAHKRRQDQAKEQDQMHLARRAMAGRIAAEA